MRDLVLFSILFFIILLPTGWLILISCRKSLNYLILKDTRFMPALRKMMTWSVWSILAIVFSISFIGFAKTRCNYNRPFTVAVVVAVIVSAIPVILWCKSKVEFNKLKAELGFKGKNIALAPNEDNEKSRKQMFFLIFILSISSVLNFLWSDHQSGLLQSLLQVTASLQAATAIIYAGRLLVNAIKKKRDK